jgi:predicted amidophosphoribosyltransferase
MKKPIYCKSCFQEIRLSPLRSLTEENPLLCDDCISQIEVRLETVDFAGIKVLMLSSYSGILKTWLMNYKELGDIELAPCFLFLFLPVIRLRFAGYSFVPCPSLPQRSGKRGFRHLPAMLKASSLPFIEALGKTGESEQKDLNGNDRRLRKGIFLTPEAKKVQGRKVVLFDDVLTTGSTLRESLAVLKGANPRKTEAMILMDNSSEEARRMK